MKQAASVSRLLGDLARPPREATPIPFWFLNGDLTHREIRRQMLDFRDHGIYGAVLHPRMGLPPRIGYLSPAFFRYLRTAVETAEELGMYIVLYDEGMYPSGSAGGQIVRERPELASRGIVWTDRESAGAPGDRVLCETAEGRLVERYSGGTIRGVHFGEDDGEPHAPRSADILNPEAVRAFIRLTHEAYAREFSPWFGRTILAFFTDEPSILGRNAPRGMMPWTAGFDRIFQAAGGRLENLRGLFTGEENEDTGLYRRLILEREGEVYYGALSRWCEDHGLALMGHPHQSDDIEPLRYFQIPGQDLVYRWVGPETGGTAGMDSVMAKCGADMARLTGRERNANECFGACNRDGNPWYFTGGDMKWFLDYLAVRGVNMFVPHAFFYSLRGRRSQERPPDVGPGSRWWPYYRQWAGYMARLSCLMAETEVRISLAVPCRNRDLRPEEAEPLFRSQRAFQYLPESCWAECREEGGKLRLGKRVYEAVTGDPALFPSVSHDPEKAAPDLLCDPPQPELRTAALETGDGGRLWFLVNEGPEPISARVTLPTHDPLGRMNLWTGERTGLDSADCPEGRRLDLRLERRESLLLFERGGETDGLPPEEPAPALVISAGAFSPAEEDPVNFTRTYTAELSAETVREIPEGRTVLLWAEAEEMAELYVNGRFCGVSFWSPHRIPIPRAMLGDGSASLRLVISGSLANRYGRPVPYGLK